MSERFTDRLTYVLSVALAVSVIAFAAYKVVKLSRMDDPPANMGLNFPPPKRKVILDPEPSSDPITTETITLASPRRVESLPRAWSPVSGATGHSYELLAVVDGVAFVEVGFSQRKALMPATVGTVLPGGLRVAVIERRNGRWVLVAGNFTLEQVRRRAQ
jgi:hypothetical protein